jgi:hypothetical protein
VIAIADTPHADASDEVHPHAVVALDRGTPVEVQILYPEIANHQPPRPSVARVRSKDQTGRYRGLKR